MAVSAEETSFPSLQLFSCCVRRLLADHRPAVVPGPGVGEPSSKKSEMPNYFQHHADYLCVDFQIPFAQGTFLVKHLDTKQNCINTSGRNTPLMHLIHYTSLCNYTLLFISATCKLHKGMQHVFVFDISVSTESVKPTLTNKHTNQLSIMIRITTFMARVVHIC